MIPGRLVVVGGHSRHVGKTSVVSEILRCLQPSEWAAVKISSHSHGTAAGLIEEEGDAASASQAARYLRAGARRAFLMRATNEQFPAAAEPILRMVASGRSIIVESNRLVAHCRPDLVIFVVAPGIADWKPSSAICLRSADAVVMAGEGDLPLEAVELGGHGAKTLPLFRLERNHEDRSALAAWLRCKLEG